MNNRRFPYVILLLLLVTASDTFGDSPIKNEAYVITSSSGKYFFKMVPPVMSKGIKGHGVAYEVKDDGKLAELWRVEGWFSNQNLFLSDEGKFLIRVEGRIVGKEPKQSDLGVAFYQQGKLLKAYSPKDLVDNKKDILNTVSSYFWLALKEGLVSEDKDPEAGLFLCIDNTFRLKTIDGRICVFDISNGKLISSKKGAPTAK